METQFPRYCRIFWLKVVLLSLLSTAAAAFTSPSSEIHLAKDFQELDCSFLFSKRDSRASVSWNVLKTESEGREVSERRILRDLKRSLSSYPIPPDAKIFFMGSGKTGDVYRIRYANGRNEVIKIYHLYGPSSGGPSLFGSATLELDLKRLQILTELSEQLPARLRLGIVQPERLSAFILRMDWVKGQDLGFILFPEKRRLTRADQYRIAQIRDLYEVRLRALKSLIKNHMAEISDRLSISIDEDLRLDDQITDFFALSPRNLILDPETLRMTIIDPK